MYQVLFTHRQITRSSPQACEVELELFSSKVKDTWVSSGLVNDPGPHSLKGYSHDSVLWFNSRAMCCPQARKAAQKPGLDFVAIQVTGDGVWDQDYD